jgi:hypothetical protein
MDTQWKIKEDERVETLRVLALSQSLYNVACDVTIRGTSATAVLTCTFRVFFDPSSDDVTLVNTDRTSTILVTGSCKLLQRPLAKSKQTSVTRTMLE